MDELRFRPYAEMRVIHSSSERYSWQDQFASWIATKLGINPLRSYRLDDDPNPYNTGA